MPLGEERFECRCWGAPRKWVGAFLLSPWDATMLMDLSPHQALFALSSMLRHFPYAQQQFLKLGGLQVLRSLFRQKGMETLYVRVVTLLYDLIMEKVRSREGGDKTWPGSPHLHPLTEPKGPSSILVRTRVRRGRSSIGAGPCCWDEFPPSHGPLLRGDERRGESPEPA